MLHIVLRAFLAAYIIMTNHILLRQVQLAAKTCSQLYQGIIGGLIKGAAVVRVAVFNGDGVVISGSGGIGHLCYRNALDHLAFQPNHEMGAGGSAACLRVLIRQTIKIIPVGLGG